MADTAYDADHLRQAIAAKGAIAVIPNNPSRALKHSLDKDLYAQRYLVECCFSKLKQLRRVATRLKRPNLAPIEPIARVRRPALTGLTIEKLCPAVIGFENEIPLPTCRRRCSRPSFRSH